MMVQQLQEETVRAVKVSVSTDLETEDITAEGIFEARDIAISAAETAEGWANTFPAIADELDVNIVLDEADLRAKLAAIGASNATLVIAKPIPIAEDLTIPSNVALSFKKTGQLQPASGKTITINGNVEAGLWQIFDGDGTVEVIPLVVEIYPEWFGAAGDGITDDTTAIQKALDSGAKTISLSAKTYFVSDQLTVPKDVSLIGRGRNATIISAEGNTTGAFTENAVVCKFGDEPTQISALALNVVKTQNILTFASNHNLAVGDVILIYNLTDASWNSNRTYYRAGEYCTIAEVTSPTEVILENGLYDNYLAADVNIYKCDGYCSGVLRGFTAIAPGAGPKGAVRAIAIEYGHKIELDDLGAKNSDHASFGISKSYKVNGRALDCFQWSESPGFGTQYGLVIGNSQECDITGTFVGWRHGITMGGGEDYGIPCRAVNVHDFVAKKRNGSIAAADWHGNCEFCIYENGQVFGGGLNIAGNNNRISGIKALGNTMMLILGREILGCNHVVENIECYASDAVVGRGLINIGANETAMDGTMTRYGGQFIFRNIHITAPYITQNFNIFIRNRGFVAEDWDVLCDNIVYDAPNIRGSYGCITVNTMSGNNPRHIQATNIMLSSNVGNKLVLGAQDATSLVRQDGLAGQIIWAVTTAESNKSNAVTFIRGFSKKPAVVIGLNQHTTGQGLLTAYALTVTRTAFTARVERIDTNNFHSDMDVAASWAATLWEW
jgi:hypothetical protein